MAALGYGTSAVAVVVLGFVSSILVALGRRGLRSPLQLLGRTLAEGTPEQYGKMHRRGKLEPVIGTEAMRILERCAGFAFAVSQEALFGLTAEKSDPDLVKFWKQLAKAGDAGMKESMLCFRRAVYYGLPAEHVSLERAREIEGQLAGLSVAARRFAEGDSRQVVAISELMDRIRALGEIGGNSFACG